MQVWRLFPGRFRDSAFTGVGGLYAARRWNHLGTEMVYTSTSRALAALEFFVNLQPNEAPNDLLMAEASVSDVSVEAMKLDVLPRNWRSLDNQRCRDLGSEWARSLRSVALKVPSAVVDGDWNILLNPKHPNFIKVKIGAAKPFRFDDRMYR
jgi:RES domain-containing protein